MKEKHILALDQGTTSSRAVLVKHNGSIESALQREFKQYFPQPGWVEHDPLEIWSTQIGIAAELVAAKGLCAADIAAIGITNQRETTLVWERKTGKPVYNAIVWQDKRTARFCDELKKNKKSDLIRNKTGLIADAYFSATKIRWILDNVEGARARAENGELVFGTIDTWLIWNLTQGELHITDVSNASRTLLFNIHTMEWDREMLELFNVPECMLPEVKQSSELYGTTSGLILGDRIPIAGIAGDQQAALFGQMCTTPGMLKNTYGTGCFLLMNIGDKPVISSHQLLTTIAWKINGETQYALEGSIFIAGAVVQWLRDNLNIIIHSSEVEQLAKSVKSSEGVYFIPAFSGLGAPYWNQQAKGTIFGITRGTTKAHIARAALESIAYQTMDVIKSMEVESGISIKELRVDGGATVNNMLLQFQSDILNIETLRPRNIETTVMGAAFLAGLGIGFWKNINELNSIWQLDSCFVPNPDRKKYENGINGWERAIKALECWSM
jgi:glycerol kinase